MRELFFTLFPSSFQIMLQKMLFGNSFGDILWAFVLFVTLLFCIYVFRFLVFRFLSRPANTTETLIDDFLRDALGQVSSWFYFYTAFYLTTKVLALPDMASQIFDALFLIFVVAQLIKVTIVVLEYSLNSTPHGKDPTLLQGVKMLIRIVFWVVGILLVLSNLGVDITALTASLGIGGIAVALAVQNILADLFAALSIYFDRPFKVGDTIQIGADIGVVKKIGLKSTRLTTLQGEVLVVSNKELTEVRVQNFKPMRKRRVIFQLGFEYGTSSAKLKKFEDFIENLFASLPKAEFGRVHFVSFGDSALIFEVMYHVLSQDYDLYMDLHAEVLFGIKEMCEKEGLEMAFPTQTIHVVK